MMKRGIDGQTRLRMEQRTERDYAPYEYPTEGMQSIMHYKRIEDDKFISFVQTNDYANKQRIYILTKFDGKYPQMSVTTNRTLAGEIYDQFEKDVFG